jgi:UDP-N-acetylmuramoyl-L-alanyl-D-glutamate--2,6-diaminopimelate ligase
LDVPLNLSSIPDLEVLGVQEDSRLVRSGDLFIARSGTQTDGRRFAEDARCRGAVAIVTSQPIEGVTLPQIVVPDPARAASLLAHEILGNPTRSLAVVGVTGTNGKTTTTYLIRHLLASFGKRCGLVGTVEIDDGRARRIAEMTTPGAVQLAELFAVMRDHGCDSCAVETSSHALDQQRVAGVRYAAAGFTNLTGDHLDYHGTMEAYADAKAKLFEMLDTGAVACVNADSPFAERMVRDCRARVVRFSMKSDADWTARDIRTTASGTTFILHSPDGSAELSMKLVGRHNVENTLCAASLVGERFGMTVHQIASAMKTATGAPGRLQPVDVGQPFAVLVDYAHTDDALENVLRALRPITRGKLRLVFGCGGDRDRTKRPRMAKVAERLADVVYVTSDNPRTEDPLRIIEDIRGGFSPSIEKPVRIEPDRRAAIEMALTDAASGDCVLIAGKGHENYQIVGTIKHHFDDVEEANRVLRGIAVR